MRGGSKSFSTSHSDHFNANVPEGLDHLFRGVGVGDENVQVFDLADSPSCHHADLAMVCDGNAASGDFHHGSDHMGLFSAQRTHAHFHVDAIDSDEHGMGQHILQTLSRLGSHQ